MSGIPQDWIVYVVIAALVIGIVCLAVAVCKSAGREDAKVEKEYQQLLKAEKATKKEP